MGSPLESNDDGEPWTNPCGLMCVNLNEMLHSYAPVGILNESISVVETQMSKSKCYACY